MFSENKSTTHLGHAWLTLPILFFLAVVYIIWLNYSAFANSVDDEFSDLTYQRQHTIIFAAGDIMLSRHVGSKIREHQSPELPFVNLEHQIRKADIAFANLECPLSNSNIPLTEGLIFRCLISDAEGLFSSDFDILSTANNHSFDQGEEGIDFTINYLSKNGILPVGTGSEKKQIIQRNDINFGFIAYSYTAKNDGGKSQHPAVATMDIDQLKQDITELKKQADIIIVSMHAGIEYVTEPNQQQTEFAREAIDAGADVVIGHHPHWVQTIEVYKNKPIFYSLGNFVFDQEWSQETKQGLTIELEFQNKKLKQAKLNPIIIENYCCARPANENEAKQILNRIGRDDDIINF